MDLPSGPLDWLVPTDDGAAVGVTRDVARAVEVLCADLDPARIPEWHRHLMYSAAAVFGTPSTAPDRTHPATYVVLEKDNGIFPASQETMAAQADHIERLATSHVPQLADPEGLAAILTRISTPA